AAPSGSTSQARTGWPSSAVAVTSSSRPGSVTGTPGQSSAPGSAPVVRSMRTGVGGESTAARSAYRYRPSGSGFRSVYAPSSGVTRVTSPLPTSTRNTGHRPPSSAVTYSALESGAQASPFGQRSQPASRSRPGPEASAASASSRTTVRSTGRWPVACRSRRQAMYRPSGETRGFSKSYSGTDSSTRRLPLATSIATSSQRDSPAGSHIRHPVITEAPSGVSSNGSPSSARPGSGVRSRRRAGFTARSAPSAAASASAGSLSP